MVAVVGDAVALADDSADGDGEHAENTAAKTGNSHRQEKRTHVIVIPVSP